MFHTLFRQGANNSIDKIKKTTENVYNKHEKFTDLIVKLTTAQTDVQGKKKFRVKDDPALLA